MWLLYQSAPENPAYNLAVKVHIGSHVDRVALRDTFQALVDRHASLRTTFTTRASAPVQRVHARRDVSFPVTDASAWSQSELARQTTAVSGSPFDLEKGPLMRLNLFTRSATEHILVVTLHHIVVDGWSAWLILNEARDLYAAAKTGRPVSLPALPAQYADYVRWQSQMLAGPEGERAWAYWRQQLAGQLPTLSLPTDRPRPSLPTYNSDTHSFVLGRKLTSRLKSLAGAEGVTLFTLLLATFQVLLYGYTGQEDIVVGTPVAGRSRARFARIVGNFINMVALRSHLGGDLTFRALLGQVQQTVSGALAHQHYPFPLLVERLSVTPAAGRAPMFQAAMVLQKPPRRFSQLADLLVAPDDGRPANFGHIGVKSITVSQQQGQLDLLLEFLEARDTLQASLRYNPDLFDAGTVAQLEQHLRRLLTEVTDHPDRRLSSWPFLDRLRSMARRQKAAGPGDSADDPLSPARAPDQKTEPVPVAAPRTSVEETLVQIWGDVLGKERIDRHTNFFECGGHSLLAAQVVSRVRQILAVEVPLSSLFEAPTVAQFAARIEAARQAEGKVSPPAIQPIPRDGELPLSFSQERMWFMHQWQPQSSAYNVSLAVRLKGVLEVGVLEQSFHELERRHETLRTVIDTVEERPLQSINPPTAPELPLRDLTGFPPETREAEAQSLIHEEARPPFDLSRGPLWRTILFRLGPQEHILLLTMHHIISDAWSLGVVMRELAGIYDAFVAGNASPLPPPSLQYADFAYWQRQRFQGEAMTLQLAYWRQQLADVPVLSLPTDRPRPAVQTYKGKVQSRVPEANLFSALDQLSQDENVTLFMTLLAAFQVLLYRYTGQTDIVVGVPVANRHWPASEELIGTLVNTLVLRVDLDGDLTFRRLLQRVREVALAAYAHQDLPFARLVAGLRPQRDTSHSPLFQVMFDYTNIPVPAIELPGLSWDAVQVDRGAAQFDLTLAVTNTERMRRLGFEYNTDLFDDGTISRMLAHLQMLLTGIVSDPDTPVSRLPLLTDAERQQLLVEWNRTRMDYPQDRGLRQLFEARVERTPDKVAVVFAGERLSYRELNQRANRLARYLQTLGVGTETLVGIGLQRSLQMVVALLGVLKAGGAYVPLDPNFPRRRLSAMVADARVKLLLTQQSFVHLFQETAVELVCLDRDWPTIAGYEGTNLSHRTNAGDLAYVIYTSGSTGRPKGVQIEHGAVVNFLTAMQKEPGLTAQDVLLAVTTLSFDIAVLEIFLPLVTGARLVLVDGETAVDGRRLAEALADSGATVMQATPATWRMLLESDWRGQAGLKILCGGEAWSPGLAHRLLQRCRSLWNMYGPTETTIWSAVSRVRPGASTVSIGRPIGNTQFYVLDPCLQPVPIGVPGELYVGGVGLARGYLNRPALTARKFIRHPFSQQPGARLYRTGDLVRALPDGQLEFLGRVDNQVKVRGFRIELGEVEAALNRHPQVRSAVVAIKGDGQLERRLVAYVIARASAVPSASELRSYVKGHLPEYMVPSVFVFLEQLPLTPNRKIDRRALPAPDPERPSSETVFTAPRNKVEARLVRIWEELLSVRPVGIGDDFFELGGHSLLAVRLLTRIQQRFGTNLPLTALFRDATVKHLAALISRQNGASRWSSLVEIQPQKGNGRRPFFCVHGITGDVFWFRELARHMQPDRPFYGLQSQGLDGVQPPLTSVEAMAAHYIDEVQSLQPEGPYFMGGYSYGGNIAFEMARQLQARGLEVGLLAVLDHAPVGSDYYRVRWGTTFLVNFLKKLPYRLQDLLLLRPDQVVARIRRHVNVFRRRLKTTFGATKGTTAHIRAEELIAHAAQLPAHVRRLVEVNHRAMAAYQPQPYHGRVTLFRARGGPLFCSHDPEMGWGKLAAGGVDVRVIPGSHLRLFEEPYIRYLAQQLNDSMEAVEQTES